MSTEQIIMIVSVCVAAAALGVALFRVDTKIENRRRAAMKLAQILRDWGLKRVPAFLEDYAVGDYSGMLSKIRDTVELMSDPKAVMLELEPVFETVLEQKLKDPAQRGPTLQRIEELKKLTAAAPAPSTPAVPAPSPAAATP
jgi:hypothetical protein